MSAQSEGTANRLVELAVDQIKPNERNPRLVFPEEELDRLAQSIAQEGILVPVVVYEDGDSYTLVDGERRHKCAIRLGLETVPALITEPDSEFDNLVKMFNIHQMREQWRDIPTARALDDVAKGIIQDTGNEPTISVLAERTGLSTERVKRLRYVVQLPLDYQGYVSDGTIPLNWFWELHLNVIVPLAKGRKALFDEFGKDKIRSSFVEKRLAGVITDTVSLRKVRPIINFATRDAEESGNDVSILDDTLRKLITDEDLTIATAYEDTVQIMVETDKLQRSTINMIKGFERLFARTRSREEQAMVLGIAGELHSELERVIDENSPKL